MVLESLSTAMFREQLPLDLRPFHSALTRACTILDVVHLCQATTMAHGAGLWLVVTHAPLARACAGGPEMIEDRQIMAALREMVAPRQDAAVSSLAVPAPVCRWHDSSCIRKLPLPRDYAQIELTGRGQGMGLVRVYAQTDTDSNACNWEAVEQVMWAAAPYLLLCLEREGSDARVDALTGLYSESELQARVEREVDLARTRPVELALVIMELRLGEGRETNVLTEAEWRAVGATVRSTFRETDSASRLSDGRLAVLMPMTNQRHALMASARLVDRLRKVPGLPEDLSCQAGISGWTFEGASAPELFEQASTALVGARIAGARGAFVFV